jgi:FtsX extracellular domain
VRRVLPALLLGIALVATGCGGSSGSAGATGPLIQPSAPRIKAFLKLPVAAPASCASNVSGTTSGRISPWVGHVDISAFLDPHASASTVKALASGFRSNPAVLHVYYESKAEAFREFQRLYTCSASTPNPHIPASYRVVLKQGTTVAARNRIVGSTVREPGVETVSCDPSNPCVDIVQSAQPRP